MKFGTLPLKTFLMHNAVAESNTTYSVFQVRTIYVLQSELLSKLGRASFLVIWIEAGLHRPGLYNIISTVQLYFSHL